MFSDFNFENIHNIEFSLKIDDKKNFDGYQSVPTSDGVKSVLKDVLTYTVKQIKWIDESGTNLEPERFELTEKYKATEPVIAPYDDEMFGSLRELVDTEDEAIDTKYIDEPKKIPHYRVKFYDDNGNVIVAFKTASQFKSILKHRNRIARLYNDSLVTCDEPYFKIDDDFDFLILGNTIAVYRPNSFKSIASINQYITEAAESKIDKLSQEITFCDFDSIRAVACESRSISKLIVAVARRNDLSRYSRERLEMHANTSGISLIEVDGQLSPAPGQEVEFLELIDRRRYGVEFETGSVENYRAESRKLVLKG
uniref:DUF4868 domain-containing protein n=1 Tax=Enterovibrio norvegicus TaxID=188144 RepID=A0A0H3ZX72_9GAMM|nr:hypothetical protein [Enterovibrio norvegicus]